jgi:tetratricopeptide (TPR) repeat protein
MKKRIFSTIAALFCCVTFSSAQGTDDESIRKVIESERKASQARDSVAYFDLFTHDPSFAAIYIGNNYYSQYHWKDLYSEISTNWKRPLTRKRNTSEYSDIKIKSLGDNAIAEFVSKRIDSVNKPVWQSLDTWSFVKNNGSWKINKILSIDTTSYNPNKPLNDANLEAEINLTGYRLLAVKKFNHAIKVFKMNVELFPKAWNTYDSLGEAYAMAGNKKEAIINYEKSIALNPENTNGKTFLAKLKSPK